MVSGDDRAGYCWCSGQQVDIVEERRGGFKAAILREGGFPVSNCRFLVWILFVHDEPMGLTVSVSMAADCCAI